MQMFIAFSGVDFKESLPHLNNYILIYPVRLKHATDPAVLSQISHLYVHRNKHSNTPDF